MHNIEYITLNENCNKKNVFNEIAEEADRYGDGLYYDINWYERVEPLENYESAVKWIESHDRGNYDNLAVRYYSYNDVEDSKKGKEIIERIKAEEKKLAEYTEKHSVLTFKAEFIGCQKCGSKIAKIYLRGDKCPVCGGDLRSKTTLDTIKGYNRKIYDLKSKYADEKYKSKKNAKIVWLLKYEYHS